MERNNIDETSKVSIRTIYVIVTIVGLLASGAVAYVKATNISKDTYIKDQKSIELAIRESISESLKPLSEEVRNQGDRLDEIAKAANSIQIKLNSGLFLPTSEFVKFKEN